MAKKSSTKNRRKRSRMNEAKLEEHPDGGISIRAQARGNKIPVASLHTSDATAILTRNFVWRGKDEQDWSDLVVHAPPLYIQEKVHTESFLSTTYYVTTKEREHDTGQIHRRPLFRL